jgi:uncharacterized protein YutE (UPF0331/DUF86 family)
MDWKQLVASLIQNLAWPITILVMFFLVRDQIGKLIEKLGKLKYKDLELDFSKVKNQAEKIPVNNTTTDKSTVIKDSESDQVFHSLEDQIFETVESAPSAAIFLAWSYVETALSSAVSRVALEQGVMSASPLQNIQVLEKLGELSNQQVELLHELRVLRNKVTHDQSTSVSIRQEQALDYSKTAIELSKLLNNLNRKRKAFMLPSGDWINVLKDHTIPSSRTANVWNYSCIDIPNSNLTAGAGAWKKSDDEIEYFGIDIEQNRKSGSAVVSELLIDLKHVSQEVLTMSARNFVTFDPETKIIKFDLGKSVFEYKLQ